MYDRHPNKHCVMVLRCTFPLKCLNRHQMQFTTSPPVHLTLLLRQAYPIIRVINSRRLIFHQILLAQLTFMTKLRRVFPSLTSSKFWKGQNMHRNRDFRQHVTRHTFSPSLPLLMIINGACNPVSFVQLDFLILLWKHQNRTKHIQETEDLIPKYFVFYIFMSQKRCTNKLISSSITVPSFPLHRRPRTESPIVTAKPFTFHLPKSSSGFSCS